MGVRGSVVSNATAAALTPAFSQREREFDSLWRALDQLTDPEIPVITLREMGILRDVRRGADGRIEVVITPTYSGCPAMEQIADDVATTLKSEGVDGRVVTQLAPAWTTDWMSEVAREKLRAYGIAPPRCASGPAGESAIQFAPQIKSCSRLPDKRQRSIWYGSSDRLPALRLHQHHRNFALRLHRVQVAASLPRLHGAV